MSEKSCKKCAENKIQKINISIWIMSVYILATSVYGTVKLIQILF